MESNIELKKIINRIQTIKTAAEELTAMSENIPTLARNSSRILANVKMLEINFADLPDVE